MVQTLQRPPTVKSLSSFQAASKPTTAARHNLLGYDRKALTGFFAERGESAYRARQLLNWIHAQGCDEFQNMSDLSAQLRERLAREAHVEASPTTGEQVSRDGTRKWLFNAGGATVEAVLIPEPRRQTLCVSSQAGCALSCSFCRTGMQGFQKNLTAAQIVGQLWTANRLCGAAGKATNVVFMGMGEPLLNLAAVAPALRLMTDPLAYGLSRRRVTVSTAGIVPGIDRLRTEAPVALAISLHAAENSLRDELVPVNRRYPLAELMAACRRYLQAAPRDFITFEYTLLRKVNDSPAQARDVAKLLRTVPAKVNLIPFNHFDGAPYRTPAIAVMLAFRDELNKAGLIATLRRPRGTDIMAACGQLAGKVNGRTVFSRPQAGPTRVGAPQGQ